MMMENMFRVPESQFSSIETSKLEAFRELVNTKISTLRLWKTSQHVDSILLVSIQENLNKLLDLLFSLNRELERRS